MKKLQLKVITPEKIIYDQQVREVILPTKDGVVGILPDHVPFMAPLKADELEIKVEGDGTDSDTLNFAVDVGLAEFVDNQLTVLVADAVQDFEIDLELAEAAKKRAQELMEQKVEVEDYTSALGVLEREIAKIKVASKYRLKRR